MRAAIIGASHLYLTSAAWFAVFVGASIGYVRFTDMAMGALGVDSLIASVVIVALGVSTASAAAWLVWTKVRRDYRAPVGERRTAPVLDPA